MRRNPAHHFLSPEGFTMVEIILVLIIIATLAVMVVPRLSGRSEQAKIEAAKADVQINIPTALKLYELDNGFFPTTEQGLTALVEKTGSKPIPENWNGPYLEKYPIDPWGRPYQYRSPGVQRPHGYDLYSLGKNPAPDSTKDDITNW